MCSNRRRCIYAVTINSFFDKEQSLLKQIMFYLWLLDEEGKDEKERHLEERFDRYGYLRKKKMNGTEKMFFEIMRKGEFKNEHQSAKQQ